MSKKLYRIYFPTITAVVVLGCVISWWVFNNRSGVERGFVALRSAYQTQRPVEARLTDFAYAPQQRSIEESVNHVQRDLAARLLFDEVDRKRNSAEAHRAVGQLYLASREYDQAVDKFKESLKLNPNDAKASADLGATLLEMGKLAAEAGRSDAVAEYAESLQHLNRALQLNNSLTEALFNRALLHQYMKLPTQAEEDWRSYLAKDPNSPWASEALQNLAMVEEQRKVTSQNDEEVLQEFRNASAAGDETKAWRLVSSYHNRTGNVVFEQALDAYLDSAAAGKNDQAWSALSLLSRIGDLEQRRASENFFSELASFYAHASTKRIENLAQARAQMKRAHYGWGRSAVAESLKQFTEAKALFEVAGSDWEALFAGYWISFCLYQQHKTTEGWARLQPLMATAESRGYKWLTARMLYLSSILQYDLTNYSRALEFAERSLAVAEATDDAVAQLNGLSSLIEYYRYLSYPDKSLSYVQRSLHLLLRSTLDPIQGCRHYGFVARSLAAAGWFEAAAAYQREALKYAFNAARPATISTNLAFLGEIEAKLKRFAEALDAVHRAFTIAETDATDTAAKDRMAYASLQLGHIYRQAGNCDKAIESYDRSIQLYHDLGYFTQIYQGHKGRLFCYLALDDDSRAEQEISTALGLVESYRDKIFESSNRETFFAAEQSVYDVAIQFHYAKLKSPERAFEYSEQSRGRSLLDPINSDARVTGKNPDSDLLFRGATHPLTAEQIKQRTPAETQLVQYAMLDEELLIWVISGNKISDTAVAISRTALQEKLTNYLRLLSSPSGDHSDEIASQARELYGLLIAPVESLLDPKRQLCIVPDKALNLVPFNTLVSPATGRYLLEDYVLTVAPSATMLVLLSETAKNRPVTDGERILSVGNPHFDRRAYPELSDLPSAAWEAANVAGFYDARRVLVDDDASSKSVLAEMTTATVIHFALHSVLDDQFPTRSKFLMARASRSKAEMQTAESAVFAYDIYGLRLTHTRLAVLSACETGSGRYFGGEGVINMARPFLASGVPLVVASLWRVESNSSARLMVDFHRLRTRQGLTSAQALQQAQLAMLHGSDEALHHPYYWAPFILIGGHAGF